MSDLRCDSCRWWLRPENNQWADSYQPLKYRSSLSSEPDATRRDGKWGICLLTTYGWSEECHYAYCHPDSLALAHDHEDYGAELLTRPDFGCVQWAAKDD